MSAIDMSVVPIRHTLCLLATMKNCQGNTGGKTCKQMKGNAYPDRMGSHCTAKSLPASSSVTLAEFASVMSFSMLATTLQLQQAAMHFEVKQWEEKEMERMWTEKSMMVSDLQAEKQRLESEQQGVAIGREPTFHICTQTDDYSDASPADATVVVELTLSCSRVASMSAKNVLAPSSDPTPEGCAPVPSSQERRSSGGFSDDLSVHVSDELVSSKELKKSSSFSKLKKPLKAASKKCLAKLTQALTPAKSTKSSSVPTSIVRAKSAIVKFFRLDCLRPHVQDE